MFQLGIENLLQSASDLADLKGKRVGLVAHPASVDQSLRHSLDILMAHPAVNVTCAFGPQHGMRGEKQDNMIESDDYVDPIHKIPVFSLYGKVRRPTREMLDKCDVILVDLQDVGCRIYTFLTTLFYLLDAAHADQIQDIWVLDRPNPAGRAVEGLTLQEGFESFVGAAPLPMRHGLTLGEAGAWYRQRFAPKSRYRVIRMKGYDPKRVGEWGWPKALAWVNPSPNIPRLSATRTYPGTVMVEGTWLSEGRGTTIPLEVVGAPGFDSDHLLKRMQKLAPQWLSGCAIRPCYFEPTFHKHMHKLCAALQIHVDHPSFDHNLFRPYRLVSLYFKAVREAYPGFDIWRPPPYEYEEKLMPIDILTGSEVLRRWADDPKSKIEDLEALMTRDESAWESERVPFFLY